MAWRHWVRPIARTSVARDRRGHVRFDYRVGAPDQYIFTADIYPYQELSHPDRHLGWWRFPLPKGRGVADLRFDFAPIRRESLSLAAGGRDMALVDCWFNPEFAFDPLAEIKLVVRDPQGTTRSIEPVLLKFQDRDILRGFYARQYAQNGYSTPLNGPFLHEVHAYKLRILRQLFERYIPAGGRALDVGCGRSLFAEMGVPFPFRVVAGDLDVASVGDRAREVPDQRWGVFDASALPFRSDTFDGLFAGEVIEHVPDARQTLSEWARVLRPGGIAIVTTPNRDRVVARASRMERPYSRDHLSELSYRQLTRELFPSVGFEFVEQACIYLELWLKHLFEGPGLVEDHLQRDGNTHQHVGFMRRLLPLGRVFPSASMAMIVVGRKRPAA